MKAAALFLVLLLLCGDARPGPLIGTGDSQMAARLPLVTESQTQCAVLAARRGSQCVNLAVPGATSSSWLATQVPQAAAIPPACVIVQIGFNDGWVDPHVSQPWPAPPLDPQQTITNIYAGIKRLLAAGHEVTVITSYAAMWEVNMSMLPSYVRAQKYAATLLGQPMLDGYGIAASCWLTAPGQPEYAACLHGYGADTGSTDIGIWSHPAAPGRVAIADLCNQPANAHACACRP